VIPRALHALGEAAGHAAVAGDEALLAVPVAEFATALRRSPTRAAAAMALASFRGGVGAVLVDLDDDDAAHVAMRLLETVILELAGPYRRPSQRKVPPRPTGEAIFRHRR
jgi:hypothetical protein